MKIGRIVFLKKGRVMFSLEAYPEPGQTSYVEKKFAKIGYS